MNRIEQEKRIITCMIKLYCLKNHHKQELCPSCLELENYAHDRLSRCRYGENKTFCNSCNTHCYSKKYKEHIKKVMRFSGPRLIFYHPIIALKHIFSK